MELRRAGEIFVSSFLTPSVTRQSTFAWRAVTSSSPITRTFRQQSILTTRHLSTTPTLNPDRTPSQSEAADLSTTEPTTSSSSSPDFAQLLNRALDGDKGVPTASTSRTSNYKSSSAQSASRRPHPNPISTSLDELYDGFTRPRSNSNRLSISSALDPRNTTRVSALKPISEPLSAYGPSVGRTVAINAKRGIDVGRAFRSLDINCSRNRVKQDFQRQRFHERPGLKRKRLKSERWRRRFREGFKGMVKMVGQMRKQGW